MKRPGAYVPSSVALQGERDRYLNIAGFLLFSVLLIVRLVAHQIWRDEAQAWLIVAAAKSPLDLLVLQSEVHPPLWYWILYVVQLFTSNLYAMKLATGLLAVGTLALLWFVSSFKIIDKVLISAGYYLSWQYGIFSRNYILGVFLLFFFAVLWGKWRHRPALGGAVLGLASLTHAFFIPIAGILGLLFIYDWWREERSLKFLRFGSVFAILTIAALVSLYLASPTVAVVIKQAAPASEAKEFFSRIGYAFTIRLVGEPFETIVGIVFFAAFLPLLVVTILTGLAAVTLSVFQVVVYGGTGWHVGTIYTLLVCVYAVYHHKMYWVVPRALIALSAAGGVAIYMQQTIPISAGTEAANLIRTLHLENAAWTAYPDVGGTVPFAVLKRPFWSLECGCDVTFIPWWKRSSYLPASVYQDRLAILVAAAWDARKEPAYMLLGRSIPLPVAQELLSHFRVEKIGETGPAAAPEETYQVLRFVNP